MADASIPVDLFNPGQVFACLGFLEAADVLLGEAEGGFDWSDESRVRFLLRAGGNENPFAVVLKFLAEAEIHRRAPGGYADPPPKKKASAEDDDEEDSVTVADLRFSESFPNGEADRMALPIQLDHSKYPPIAIGHWADGSRRNAFKLYRGNRSAHRIAYAMLHGTRRKAKKKQTEGDVDTRGVAALWDEDNGDLTTKPFEVLTLMGGSFNFDARGAWTPIDAGFSPDRQKKVKNIEGITASPVVQFLSAWGLEHARPDEYDTRQVRYGAWSGFLPPILARPALAGVSIAVPIRTFRFVLDLSGKNKVVTFAQEEINV